MNTIPCPPPCLPSLSRYESRSASPRAVDPVDTLTETEKAMVGAICGKFCRGATEEERAELEGEGRLALIKSARLYQSGHGTVRSTYLFNAVRWAIVRAWQKQQRERQMGFTGVSLDAPIAGPDTVLLGDMLPSDTPDPAAALVDGYIARNRRKLLSAAFSRLTEKQQLILRLYFGDGLTLEECGARLGVTRQCIHARLKRALECLRADADIDRLRGLLDS